MDCFQMKLLSRERHHDEIERFNTENALMTGSSELPAAPSPAKKPAKTKKKRARRNSEAINSVEEEEEDAVRLSGEEDAKAAAAARLSSDSCGDRQAAGTAATNGDGIYSDSEDCSSGNEDFISSEAKGKGRGKNHGLIVKKNNKKRKKRKILSDCEELEEGGEEDLESHVISEIRQSKDCHKNRERKKQRREKEADAMEID